jgi:DnaJ domain
MPPPRKHPDPNGYYARLGVELGSGSETITAAYRRNARLVHPDVPKTGDAEAFMELKRAYDVLSHVERRAAYDRSAMRDASGATAASDVGEIGPAPSPRMATPSTRHPRWQDLPIAVWAGLAVLLLVGVIEAGMHLFAASPAPRRETIPATAREVPPPAPNDPIPSAFGPAPVRLAGTPNFYILPTPSPTMLWREDKERHTLVPWGILPPFSAVQGIRLFRSNGMVEVRVTDGATGFIEAGRLNPGDTSASARAWCTYNAGPTPRNGEILTRNGRGPARLTIDNRSGQPAVVKLRSAEGGLVASVFLGPGGRATMDGLPEEDVRLDFATGEAWSRSCHGFTAGMRAQRVPNLVTLGLATTMAIPPDPRFSPVDLSDQAFEQD